MGVAETLSDDRLMRVSAAQVTRSAVFIVALVATSTVTASA
jgi:hypothetical protein